MVPQTYTSVKYEPYGTENEKQTKIKKKKKNWK